ncbi:MAG: S1 RNA-binding domain-containing protein [Bacteroidota bacterium]
MDKQTLSGTITFIHHEKDYATIEYLHNNKTKSINGNISEKEQMKLKEMKAIKKTHSFRIGDEVSFVIVPSVKGDKMVAGFIEFRFNNAYSNLINKAGTENRFVGYLKKVDDDYFVKETGSYILFPLIVSPWEIPPHESRMNEPVFFKLDNIDKPNAVTASLFKSEFIPEYKTAQQYHKNKTAIDGTVYKVTPFGIFINFFNNKIQAKIPVAKDKNKTESEANVGDKIKVMITYLSPVKIVVERVD